MISRRSTTFVVLWLAGMSAPACGGSSSGSNDARTSEDALDELTPRDAGLEEARACFPCEDYWICGGDITQVHLEPGADGCHLVELPGQKILLPDGTITEDGGVLGHATGTGASIQVTYPDGGQWLYCRGGGGCPPP